jgi:prepilin-type N-terminal cleavage/methylation domain-containing protein
MRAARAGFTLIEILVVLTIIGVLAALSAGVVLRYIEVQKSSNTRTALDKLGTALRSQWDVVAEKASREDRTPFLTSYVQPIAGNDPGRQKVVYIKLRLVQAFPMTFDEVLKPAPLMLPPLKVYQQQLQTLGITGSSAATARFESSALLLMALQVGVSGQKFNPEDFGANAFPSFRAGNGNLQALVDGWGSPLAFFRWPTGNPDLNPNGARPGTSNDSTDREGYLTSPTWLASSSWTSNFKSAIGYTPPPNPGGAPQSYRLVPLLVSPGPDRLLGLDANATPDSTGAANDNLSSAAP